MKNAFCFSPIQPFMGEKLFIYLFPLQGTESESIYRNYKRRIFVLNEEKLSTNEKCLKIMVKSSHLQEEFTGVTEGIQALHGKMTKVSLQVLSSTRCPASY